jgi:hypothetical protein
VSWFPSKEKFPEKEKPYDEGILNRKEGYRKKGFVSAKTLFFPYRSQHAKGNGKKAKEKVLLLPLIHSPSIWEDQHCKEGDRDANLPIGELALPLRNL